MRGQDAVLRGSPRNSSNRLRLDSDTLKDREIGTAAAPSVPRESTDRQQERSSAKQRLDDRVKTILDGKRSRMTKDLPSETASPGEAAASGGTPSSPIKADSGGSPKPKGDAVSTKPAEKEKQSKEDKTEGKAAAKSKGRNAPRGPLKWFDSSLIPHHPLDLVKFLMTPPEREHGEVIRCYIVREPSLIGNPTYNFYVEKYPGIGRQ